MGGDKAISLEEIKNESVDLVSFFLFLFLFGSREKKKKCNNIKTLESKINFLFSDFVFVEL